MLRVFLHRNRRTESILFCIIRILSKCYECCVDCIVSQYLCAVGIFRSHEN